MSKKPLPPPPGFRRVREKDRSEPSYVYPFSTSETGIVAANIHAAFVADENQRWQNSKLKKLALRTGLKRFAKELDYLRGPQYKAERRNIYRQAASLGLFELSLIHPIFMRRDPLQQVMEHLLREHRYYMKLDIADAFGSVHLGCHTSLQPHVRTVQTGDDLFDVAEYVQTGWPFFHPGENGLIRGAPASPLIFDAYCRESGLHRDLLTYARARGCVVTGYVDDFVFSSHRPFGRDTFRTMRRLFAHYGFELNAKKSGRFDTHAHPIEFLGVSLYRGKVRPRPAFFDRMNSIHAISEGRVSWMQRIESLNLEMKRYRRKLYCG